MGGDDLLKRDINLLKARVKPFFEDFMNRLEQHGLRYTIVETLRTIEIQEAYFAQGRRPLLEINDLRRRAGLQSIGEAEGRRIITQTMQSVHLNGTAADIVPMLNGVIPWNITKDNAQLWLTFGRLGKEAGLEWGGTWTPLNQFGIGWDAPHYQYSGVI